MSRINNDANSLEIPVLVVRGIGYADFFATGQAYALIVTGPDEAPGPPSHSWIINDEKGRGVAGNGPLAGAEINWPIKGDVLLKGHNRLTLSGVTSDGLYLGTLYGIAYQGLWGGL